MYSRCPYFLKMRCYNRTSRLFTEWGTTHGFIRLISIMINSKSSLDMNRPKAWKKEQKMCATVRTVLVYSTWLGMIGCYQNDIVHPWILMLIYWAVVSDIHFIFLLVFEIFELTLARWYYRIWEARNFYGLSIQSTWINTIVFHVFFETKIFFERILFFWAIYFIWRWRFLLSFETVFFVWFQKTCIKTLCILRSIIGWGRSSRDLISFIFDVIENGPHDYVCKFLVPDLYSIERLTVDSRTSSLILKFTGDGLFLFCLAFESFASLLFLERLWWPWRYSLSCFLKMDSMSQ